MNDNIAQKGAVEITIIRDGQVVETHRFHNITTNIGLSVRNDRIFGGSNLRNITHFAVGTGTAAAAATDTDLGAILGTRMPINTTVKATIWTDNDGIVYTTTIPAGTATGALTEFGLFFDATADNALCNRLVVDPITKGAADEMVVAWSCFGTN